MRRGQTLPDGSNKLKAKYGQLNPNDVKLYTGAGEWAGCQLVISVKSSHTRTQSLHKVRSGGASLCESPEPPKCQKIGKSKVVTNMAVKFGRKVAEPNLGIKRQKLF